MSGSETFLAGAVSIALGLVGFLATVAFARFVLNRGSYREDQVRDGKAEMTDD